MAIAATDSKLFIIIKKIIKSIKLISCKSIVRIFMFNRLGNEDQSNGKPALLPVSIVNYNVSFWHDVLTENVVNNTVYEVHRPGHTLLHHASVVSGTNIHGL